MTEKPKYPAAYLPFATFLTALDRLKAISIPNQIDNGTFPSLSPQAKSQILSAFKFFELIDATGTPQPELATLVNEEAERKANIKKLIEKCYPDIVALDFAKMTPSQLDDKLSGERYNCAGETKKKAKTFLLKAALYAGFTVHTLLIKITRNRKSGTKRSASTTTKLTPIDYEKLEVKQSKDSSTNGTQKTIQLQKGGSVTLSVDVNLLELKGEDRKFVFELIDKLDQFEATLPAS